MERLCELCEEFLERAFIEISSDLFAEVTTDRSLGNFRAGIATDCFVCRGLVSNRRGLLTEAAIEVLDSPRNDMAQLRYSDTQITLRVKHNHRYRVLHSPLDVGLSSLDVGLSSIIPLTLRVPFRFDESRGFMEKTGTLVRLWLARPDLNSIAVKELASLADERGPYPALVSQIYQWIQADLAPSRDLAEYSKHQATMCQWLYPSRLVRLTELDNGVFNVEATAGWESGRSFAALSYRWSKEPALVLTGSNMSRLLEGESVQALDKNMYEAIRLVRDLGIDYIWIDALCIVQDSPADWQTESVQMERTYSTAMLTLAMHNEIDDMVPLLETLCDNLFLSCWPHCLASFRVIASARSTSDLIARAPLSGRAWCLQERLLAKRIAHILPTTVVWEGKPDEGASVSDLFRPLPTPGLGLESLAPRFSLNEIDRHAPDLPLLQCNKSAISGNPAFFNSWLTLLDDYGARSLTFESDKLVALEAVAQRLRLLTGYTYSLGIWIEFLPFCLSWHNISPCAESRSELPSWCWARPAYKPSFTRLQRGGFGLLTSYSASTDREAAVLHLKGSLTGPYRSASQTSFSIDAEDWDSDAGEVALESVINVVQDLGTTRCVIITNGVFYDDMETARHPPRQLWLSPLIIRPSWTNESDFVLIALMLTRVSGGDDLFKRLGLWKFATKLGPEGTWPTSPYVSREDDDTEAGSESDSSRESKFLQKQVSYRLM